MQRSNRNIILFIGFLSVSFLCHGQSSRSLQKITSQAAAYNTFFSKQKIYLHTDKGKYFEGESIWFRAYLHGGIAQQLDTLSKNLYVELWSPSNIRVNIIRLKLNKGMADGSFHLSDTLEQGVYQLRAFTEGLLDISPEYYFNKNIEYFNSKHKYRISPDEARRNRKKLKQYDKDKSDFEVLLTYEQVNLLENYPARVYFKATNKYGDLMPVEGYLLSGKSKKIKSFKNKYPGIGVIDFIPKAKIGYKVVFVSSDGIKKVYSLPEASKTAITGSIDLQNEEIAITLSKPNRTSNDPTANRYIVVGHANNAIYYAGVVDLRSDTVLRVPSNLFPGGVVGVSVFSSRLKEVSSYQVFNFPELEEEKYSLSSKMYGDSVILSFIVNDLHAQSTSLAISVSDTFFSTSANYQKNYYIDTDIEDSDNTNFSLSNPLETEYIQLLVKSSKMTLPEWEKVFSDLPGNFKFYRENGIVVQGRIVTEIFSFPIKEASVDLEVLDRYNDIYSTSTNDKGYFMFEGFDFYDTLKMRIIARKPSGRKSLQIELVNYSSPEIKEYNGSYFLTTVSLRDQKAYRTKMARISKEEFKKQEAELDEFYKDVIHGRPDFILYSDELNENLTVLQAIVGRVPGVQVTGDRIIIRGINTIMGSTDPLLLLDDVPTNVSLLKSIYIRDVDRIEFLKGPSASVYGIRGSNGVIAVYTKRGEFMIKGQVDFELIGYHRPDNYLKHLLSNNQPNIVNNLPQTLLWIPSVQIADKDAFEIKLKKPEKGKYIHVSLEGIDQSHKPFSQLFTIPLK
jgi:TonB-dependent SusC/RagA subfamily outer membrane receptor